jgi:hypothetical protein
MVEYARSQVTPEAIVCKPALIVRRPSAFASSKGIGNNMATEIAEKVFAFFINYFLLIFIN